jgi:molybdopterin converting factor subunit 1
MAIELEIKLFATLKDRAGRNRVKVTVPDRASVKSLLDVTGQTYPELAPALPTSLVAVNKAYATLDTIIKPGDEIALFPPVSGGSSSAGLHPTFFSVTSDDIDIDHLFKHLARPDIGAIVTFSGFVRGETQRAGLPAETRHLEYEAYEEMASTKMAQIAEEIWERFPLVKGIAIVQRTGRLEIGQTTTLVACAAAHRDQGAFEAARYGIDRLKEIVPVWKKEVGADRSLWVEGDYRPTEEDNR